MEYFLNCCLEFFHQKQNVNWELCIFYYLKQIPISSRSKNFSLLKISFIYHSVFLNIISLLLFHNATVTSFNIIKHLVFARKAITASKWRPNLCNTKADFVYGPRIFPHLLITGRDDLTTVFLYLFILI